MPLLFWFVGRTGPVRTGDFYRVLAPFIFASLCTLFLLLAFRKYVELSNPLIGCAIAFGITGIAFVSSLAVLPAGRLALQDVKDLVVKRKS
jgi:PST family polysaccharide transporter